MLFDTDACSFILSISVLVYMHEKHQMLFDTDACSFILHICVSLHVRVNRTSGAFSKNTWHVVDACQHKWEFKRHMPPKRPNAGLQPKNATPFDSSKSTLKTCLALIQLIGFRDNLQAPPILVGGLEHVFFFHIVGIIIPTNFHIFQRGGSNTNQYIYDFPFSWEFHNPN